MAVEDCSDVLMDHFRNPRNAGSLSGHDGYGSASAGECGDVICIWIRVADDRISEVSFKCKGCAAAIACGSVATVLARGKSLDEASHIAGDTIAQVLGGLPPDKRHCSRLAAEALANAVTDYVVRHVENGLAHRPRQA
ncbi:MAG TPA: iron-sulfur cluster assembly scaffold protein [Phycisphaerae bacterium]|nr:iron-sulfur cluster assembly scaffold protein [Phycisphaerae bacterium]